jgi:hypothetical protein
MEVYDRDHVEQSLLLDNMLSKITHGLEFADLLDSFISNKQQFGNTHTLSFNTLVTFERLYFALSGNIASVDEKDKDCVSCTYNACSAPGTTSKNFKVCHRD